MRRHGNPRGGREFNDRQDTADRGNFSGGFNRGPRQSFKATCAKCNAECDVPFKPTEGRPVYCRDCFQKNKH
ncbi:MAG: CxxC-x17-CxxC domain-containing protein [Candidatus Woesearchaeota archaeon]